MTSVNCQISGCDKTFTGKNRGMKSHFAFSHGLPEYRAEFEATKERIDAEKAGQTTDNYPDNWDDIRRQVYARDDHQCQECGQHGTDTELHAHHQTPISQGGTHELSNLITLCRDCHNKKHPHGVGGNKITPRTRI